MTATLRKETSGQKTVGRRQNRFVRMVQVTAKRRAILIEQQEDRLDIETIKERLGGPRTRVRLEDL